MGVGIKRVLLAVVGLLAAALPLPAEPLRTSATADEADLLKRRFQAALYAAIRPESYDHVDSQIETLRALEKDFGLRLYTEDAVELLGEQFPHLKALEQEGEASGIRKFQPVEKAARQGTPSNFVVEAIAYTAVCLPSETDYNLSYLDFLERRKWPSLRKGSEPLRYAFYLRMYKRGCLEKKAFLGRTRHLAGKLVELLSQSDLRAGDAAAYLYFLAATHRLDMVSGELLRRFVRAQEVTGSWRESQTGDPAIAAAQGAYVIRALLKRSGVEVDDMEVFEAQGKLASIPAPIPF